MDRAITVMLVDDDPAELASLALMVNRECPSWRVSKRLGIPAWRDQVMADPRAAFDGFDLVLLDYHLAGMHEGTVAPLVPLIAAEVKVVLISGSPDRIDEEACTALGVQAVLAKPFDRNDAREVMKTCALIAQV